MEVYNPGESEEFLILKSISYWQSRFKSNLNLVSK